MIWRYCPACLVAGRPGDRRCSQCPLRHPLQVVPVLRVALDAAMLTGGAQAVEEMVVMALGGEEALKLLLEERSWMQTELHSNDVDFAIATAIESARRMRLRAQEPAW